VHKFVGVNEVTPNNNNVPNIFLEEYAIKKQVLNLICDMNDTILDQIVNRKNNNHIVVSIFNGLFSFLGIIKKHPNIFM
jgi:hypothetical protein